MSDDHHWHGGEAEHHPACEACRLIVERERKTLAAWRWQDALRSLEASGGCFVDLRLDGLVFRFYRKLPCSLCGSWGRVNALHCERCQLRIDDEERTPDE